MKKSGPKVVSMSGNAKRVNVNLDEETHEILRRAGFGSVSAAIRAIVKDWKVLR